MKLSTTPPNFSELSPLVRQALLREATGRLASEKLAQTLWAPLPGPQTQAYHSQADELFYGGAAGGGKTLLLLGLALTQHRKSIIFRREYPQLKDVVMESQKLLANTRAAFNSQAMMWRDIPGGRTLEFGACQYDTDVTKYQGRAHDLKAFDEVSAFTEHQYRFLIGWARTTDPQRVRIVCAGNPPTSAEGEWVIRRWAAWIDVTHPHPAQPGELRWYAVVDGEEVEREDGTPFDWKGETIQPKSRTFIPARLSDNPYLANTGYAAILQGMPEPLRSQMLYGDFSVGRQDDPWQVIPTAWVREAMARWESEPQPAVPLTALGVDVARGGDDQTVIAKRYGHWYAPLIRHPGAETPNGEAVAFLVKQALGNDKASVNIDVIGIGASPYDVLRRSGVRVFGINFGSRSLARDKTNQFGFANRRAEAWWRFREALEDASKENPCLPSDSELLADLCAPRYAVVARGIQIESKEDIRKRLGRSTDCGDAVVLALYSPPRARWRTAKGLY